MTNEEYEVLKIKERKTEEAIDMRPFKSLESSAKAVGFFAICTAIGLLFYAGLCFAFPWEYQTRPFFLILGGIMVAVIGEAASSLMIAMAQNMRDNKITRKCMENLIARLGKPKAPGSVQNSVQTESTNK